ncbi:NmrA family transcriptional regulator [Mycolicibacterium wolinskyi]|uniref:NmrA family transcriptional regulator n=1 Tax=Mycolicibacterium wolinskyi TaxID=59750 RepID=A0A132PPJ6_9MYCO|nr:NmrA family NAD(P)-binding protein [Mycolicibacterium wolinskyi]KWX24260.1 NmrA family transcriptional regulator [Mycolicibacterium wolinskyi]
MTNPILITGATGRHGNTGEYLVRRLRDAGHPVRILARRRSERTERLAALGAEIAVGDLHDRRTLVPALADVDLTYFTYPIDAGVVSAASNYAAAVREVGRSPRTVVMSMGPAHPDSPSDLGRAQWLAEQVLDWAGLDLLILRVAALFHENLLVLHSHWVREHGVIRNSFGPGKIAWIRAGDAAELALAALLHPERFTDTVYFAKGSEEYSHVEIADLLTESSAGTIRYEPISREQWRDDLLALSRSADAEAVNAAMAQHISAVGQMVAQSGRTLPADPDALRALTGREPATMREFLLSNREAFATN